MDFFSHSLYTQDTIRERDLEYTLRLWIFFSHSLYTQDTIDTN